MKLYLDLDRTLFDTARAANIMWGKLAELYNIDAIRELDRQADFYIYQDATTYYYDFAAQLRDCAIDPVSAAALLTDSEIADNRLLFPEAKEFVLTMSETYETSILTYGDAFYQTLKMDICPALDSLDRYIVQQPKGTWLNGKGDCMLIDDKPIGNELPSHVQFIQVQLEKGGGAIAASWPICASYQAVLDELNKTM